MYLCVRDIVLSLSTILIFDVGIVPTVWYVLFFILNHLRLISGMCNLTRFIIMYKRIIFVCCGDDLISVSTRFQLHSVFDGVVFLVIHSI
jgi:hypothetical protein